MISFSLEDSKPNQSIKENASLFMAAVDKINESIASGDTNFIHLSGRETHYEREISQMINYRVTDLTKKSILQVSVNVSHFIGSYTTKLSSDQAVTINIKPRWGSKILNYLLQYTTGIYIPPDSLRGSKEIPNSAEWLLVFLWKSAFNQALRRAHIPKEYHAIKINSSVFKGRLDVPRQIRENIANQSKFCCINSPQTRDVVINRTIRYVIKLLRRNSGILLGSDMNGYDERLSSFGVQDCIVSIKEIDNIQYTKMSEPYRWLMQLSKEIIKRFGSSIDETIGEQKSFFIDISEIWENYLFAILKKHLKQDFEVVNPNQTGGFFLLDKDMRSIRPDLIIKKNEKIVAILDAKYKNYTKIGKTAVEGVSRDDLYQMITYLYHFEGSGSTSMKGLFITPNKEVDHNTYPFKEKRNHSIGILNFDLDQWEKDTSFNIENINFSEKSFVERLERSLTAV